MKSRRIGSIRKSGMNGGSRTRMRKGRSRKSRRSRKKRRKILSMKTRMCGKLGGV